MPYQKTTNQQRLPKFRRKLSPEEIGAVIQARDIEIIKLVYQYRFINSDHIRALMGSHNTKAITQRLTKLYRAGYLDRPIEQVRVYYKYEQQGSSPIIYGLGQRGAEVLADQDYPYISNLEWTRKNLKIKERSLFHDLGVANFGVALNLACQKQPDTKLLFWYQDRQDREKIQDQIIIDHHKQTIIPDAVFKIQHPEGRPLFFLEYYREILTNNKRYLEEKLLRYHYYHQQNKHQAKYDSKNFRVITLVPKKERVNNLINLIRQLKNPALNSWRFWFVDTESFNIRQPETLLQPIFRVPVDDERHKLLE